MADEDEDTNIDFSLKKKKVGACMVLQPSHTSALRRRPALLRSVLRGVCSSHIPPHASIRASQKKKDKGGDDEAEEKPAAAGGDDDDDDELDFSKKKKKKDKKPKEETDAPKAAADDDDDDDDEVDFSKKKKKKKDKKPKEEEEASSKAVDIGDDDDDDDDDVDFSKKKKKKKPKDEPAEGTGGAEDEDAQQCSEDDSDDDDDDTGGGEVVDDDDDAGGFVSIPMDREYKYEELLDRMYSLLHANNPELAGDRKRFLVKPPQVVREGSKRVVLTNFGEICKTLNRSTDHVYSFMLAEMGTTGSIDASSRMVIKGRFPPKAIEQIIRRYVSEYVSCASCKSPNTALQKENRLYFMSCNNCGARRSVTPIKTGFVAISRGARKKNRV